jgi:hypothetical protein
MQACADAVTFADANGASGMTSGSPRELLRGLASEILASRGLDKPCSDDDTAALMLAVENELKIKIPQSKITADVFRSVSTLPAMLQRVAQASYPLGTDRDGQPSSRDRYSGD